MYWAWLLAALVVAVAAGKIAIDKMESRYRQIQLAEIGQYRLLYSLLRLLESAPSGLVSTELKISSCRYIAESFSQLLKAQPKNEEYAHCVESARAQVDVLQQRSNVNHLPEFEDQRRIERGLVSLPRFRSVVEQMHQNGFIDQSQCAQFLLELSDRRLELEADSSTNAAEQALQAHNGLKAMRDYESARLCLAQLMQPSVKAARLEKLDKRVEQIRSAQLEAKLSLSPVA